MTEDERILNEKVERDKELEDIRVVLGVPAGRRFYRRLMAHCKTFHESFVVGMPDVTANNEGRRMVGNWLLSEMLDADPDKYYQMMREFKSAMVVKEIAERNKEENDA